MHRTTPIATRYFQRLCSIDLIWATFTCFNQSADCERLINLISIFSLFWAKIIKCMDFYNEADRLQHIADEK